MLHAMIFMHPERLPALLGGGLLIVLVSALLYRKHGLGTTLNVSVLRLLMFAALGFALLTPAVVVADSEQFQPVEPWIYQANKESQTDFLNRLRLAVEDGRPPQKVLINANRAKARELFRAIEALGVPVSTNLISDDTELKPMLLDIDVPQTLQQGEPLVGKVNFAGGGNIALKLDGQNVPLEDGAFELESLNTGLHVLVAELSVDGQIIQKIGAVVEVGPPSIVVGIGLTKPQIKRIRVMLPNSEIRSVGAEEFSAQDLQDGNEAVSVAVCSVKSGAEMSVRQTDLLQMFVARGGGLFVTGDGAKQVVIKYISDDFKELLPVILKAEKHDPLEDPPVKEIPGIEEIAKVSLLFLIDRSTSMNAATSTGASRWSVAVKSIEGSLIHVAGKAGGEADESLATRVGIMAFTLDQNWLTFSGKGESKKPILKTFLEYDRTAVVKKLKALKGDEDYTDAGFNTDIYAAMEEAIDVMSDEPSSVRMIVMLTDGGDNPENVVKGKVHSTLRERAIANEINIVTVGIGSAFKSDNPDSRAANRVLTELATKSEFVHLTNGETTPAIFVDSVSRAFKAYDQKKQDEEDKLEKEREADPEPETVDVLPGTFPMILTGFGAELFGKDALPEPSPKVAWFARNQLRKSAAAAIELEEETTPAALSFRAHGLGRVAFWATGTDEEALGEVASWADFPALFASSVRWLMPRVDTKLKLLGLATPEGIELLDPTDGAKYILRTPEKDIPLDFKDGQLTSPEPLPEGQGTVIEKFEAVENELGHVYVAPAPEAKGISWLEPELMECPALRAGKPMTHKREQPDTSLILYAVIFFLIVLPFERLVRRRQ